MWYTGSKMENFCRLIKAGIEQIEGLTRATVYLHNCIRLTENASYLSNGFVGSGDSTGKIIPGDWRNVMNDDKCLHDLFRLNGNRYRCEADQVKENLKDFVIGRDREVNWQYKHVRFCATVHNQENIQNTTSKASYRNTEYLMQKLHFTVIVCLLSL